MYSPLLSPTTETCGTSETRRTVLPLPPLLDTNELYWRNPSIYRVPPFITKLSPDAYMPQVVSFGPYHHGEDRLLHMEEHKRDTLCHFLNRSRKTCKPFLDSLREVAQQLEKSYETLDPKWKNGTGEQFLALMITDGCFMLEIMRNAVGKEKNDYALNHPIFSTHRMAYITPYIRRDMLMLENQLPMLVLERLVAVERDGRDWECKDYIHKLILNFYSLDTFVNLIQKNNKGVGEMDRFLHVMDVFRKGLLTPGGPEAGGGKIIRSAIEINEEDHCGPEADRRKKIRSATGPEADCDKKIRSAAELLEAGIQFKKSKTDSLKDISFSKGVLLLPLIRVDDDTEIIFLNIMTFERLHIGATTEVTSYVSFMDSIINNEKDVTLLHAQGIIQNDFGSDKEVAELFNSLWTEVKLVSNNSSFDTVQGEIRKYCEEPWHKWRANLNRSYFKNPWTIASLIAAIFLFIFTLIQTVYTVLGYY